MFRSPLRVASFLVHFKARLDYFDTRVRRRNKNISMDATKIEKVQTVVSILIQPWSADTGSTLRF